MQKNKKITLKKLIIYMIFVICLIAFIYSIINIIFWKAYSNKTEEQIIKIQEQVIIDEIEDSKETEIIKQNENVLESNPYWNYIKMNMINVKL